MEECERDERERKGERGREGGRKGGQNISVIV